MCCLPISTTLSTQKGAIVQVYLILRAISQVELERAIIPTGSVGEHQHK